MKHASFFLFVAVASIFSAAIADANPVSCESLRAKQVPGSRHVQVSFAQHCNEDLTLTSLTRDGVALKTDWQACEDFVANMGSGLSDTTADQICDCDVTAGSHTYALSFRVKYDGETSDNTFDVAIEVVAPEDLDTGEAENTADAGEPDTESLEPWSEPEPAEMQGLDCIAACKSDGPGTEAAAEAAEQESGCAVISVARELDPSPLALLLLGFIPIWLLRRHGRS